MFSASQVMPALTAEVFETLTGDPLLNDFTLIGGTALSLHIAHRISEDLDFITTERSLPREKIQQLIAKFQRSGDTPEQLRNEIAEIEFLTAGKDIDDYSQTWQVKRGIKLTFFTAEAHHEIILGKTGSKHGFTIASLEQTAQLKALVASSRSKSRDWIDLYLLERDHHFGIAEWKKAYDLVGYSDTHLEIAFKRITSGKTDPNDEKFHELLLDPPPLEEITKHFVQVIGEFNKHRLSEKASLENIKGSSRPTLKKSQ